MGWGGTTTLTATVSGWTSNSAYGIIIYDAGGQGTLSGPGTMLNGNQTWSNLLGGQNGSLAVQASSNQATLDMYYAAVIDTVTWAQFLSNPLGIIWSDSAGSGSSEGGTSGDSSGSTSSPPTPQQIIAQRLAQFDQVVGNAPSLEVDAGYNGDQLISAYTSFLKASMQWIVNGTGPSDQPINPVGQLQSGQTNGTLTYAGTDVAFMSSGRWGVSPKQSDRKFWEWIANTVLAPREDWTALYFMNHSLQDHPSDLFYNDGSYVTNEIKGDPQFLSQLQKIENDPGYWHNNTLSYRGGITFTSSQDLDLAIHTADLTITGPPSNLHVHISDYYDFNWSSNFFTASLNAKQDVVDFAVTYINDRAWASQHIWGSIVPYNVGIDFYLGSSPTGNARGPQPN